jgi:MFS family permease
MQIPTGIIADRWGPRRLLTAGCAVAAAGMLLFAAAPDVFWANAGRLLIGASVAVAFVSMLKLASHWFTPQQFTLAGGMALFMGIVGAVFAGVPLRLLVEAFGWRAVMGASGALTALLCLATWLWVRDDPQERGYRSHARRATHHAGHPSILRGLSEVWSHRNIKLLFFTPGGVVGSLLAFAGLWGVPFLTTHYGMSRTQAALVMSVLMVAWAIGGPVLGTLSERIGRRKPLYVGTLAVLLAGWSVVLLVPQLDYALLLALLVVIGFCSGNIIIGFAYAKESAPLRLAGTSSGVANMGVMMGPMILQPLVGWMLDRNWHGALAAGVRVYDLAAYRSGFALMLGWLALSFVLILLTRETGCRQSA